MMAYDAKVRSIDTPLGFMRPLKREQFDMALERQVPSATGGAPRVQEADVIEQLPKIEPLPYPNERPLHNDMPILPTLKGPSGVFKAEDYNVGNAEFVNYVANILQNSNDDPLVKSVVSSRGDDISRAALELVAYMQRAFEPPSEPIPLPDQVNMTRTALRVHNWLNRLRESRMQGR
jgi:hypothetical protein